MKSISQKVLSLLLLGLFTHSPLLAQLNFDLSAFSSTGFTMTLEYGDSLAGPAPSSNTGTLSLWGFKEGSLVSTWITGSGTTGAFVIDNGSRSATAANIFDTTFFGNEYLLIQFTTSDIFTALPTSGVLSGTVVERTITWSGTIDTSAIDEIRLTWGVGNSSDPAGGAFQSSMAVPEPAQIPAILGSLALLVSFARRRSRQ